MAVYSYVALDPAGKRQTGTIPADNRLAATDAVSGRGLVPVEIKEMAAVGKHADAGKGDVTPQMAKGKVSAAALEQFTRELANVLAAGLPLSRALHLLRRETSNPVARHVWSSIHDDVVGGTSLGDAMAKWPRTFSTVYIAMVRAGEAGGFLHVVLGQIAEFRVREQELKGKVKAAMVYPAVLACLAVGVVIFLMTFFIPRFTTIFQQFGSDLPLLTQAIVAGSHWLTSYGWLIAILVFAAVVSVRKALASEKGRRMMEQGVLSAPLLGTVAARFALVRFCRMLGTLVGAGVPLVASLRVAKEALGNQTLSDTVASAIEQVQRGVALSQSLSGSKLLFPASVIEMIAVAEETGKLDHELVRLSVSYEADLDRHLRMLVALVEPAMLFLMAAMIGTIVVGMLLPVFTLQDMIK